MPGITWIVYRVLGRHWGRIVSGSVAALLGVMLLIGSAATGQTNLLAYGFWLLIVAFGVLLLVLGIRGLNAQKASAQVSYGYGMPLAAGQPGYPSQPGTPYGQPPYGAPYGQQAAAPQYPGAAPYGQAPYPPVGQVQYPPYPGPAAPYGQPGAAPQYPGAPYGQAAYPPQQPYGQPPAGQYPYQ